MTQSGIGYIDQLGQIKLPHDLLRPLSLRYNSFLWGMYYPKNHEHDSLLESSLTESARHDYMITPVPPELWKVSARIILKLNRGKGTMGKISEFFAKPEIGISIIHAKSSRSSHRFSTWVLHVAIVPLLSKKLGYEEALGYNTEIKKYLDEKVSKGVIELHTNLKTSNYTLLFDKYDVAKSVETHPNEELHFFDWALNNKKEVVHKPFPIKVTEDGTLVATNNDFVRQLTEISKVLKEKDDYLLDTPVFGEFDSRGLNMRLFVFPKSVRPKFFEIGINYEYQKDSALDYSCIGLISSITNCIAKQKYNIWSSCNYTTENTNGCERGKLIYIVEDIELKRNFATEEKLLVTIKNLINETTLGNDINNEKLTITKVVISQLSRFKVKRKIHAFSNTDFAYDVFISFSILNSDIANLITEYLRTKGSLECAISSEIAIGDDFYEIIGSNLRSSREMVLLYSSVYHESNWRKAEQSAFWALKRIINPILLNDMSFERMDKFIDRNNAIKLLDLSDINFISDLNQKLDRLIGDIKDRKASDMLDLFEREYDK